MQGWFTVRKIGAVKITEKCMVLEGKCGEKAEMATVNSLTRRANLLYPVVIFVTDSLVT
jgi:hypothetical protein